MGGVVARAAIATCVVLFGIELSRAQGPERATATYGDWTVVCVQPSDGQKVCELVHQQIAEGQSEPVGQITIGRATKADQLQLIIQIPPNAWLASGVRFVFDDKDPGILLPDAQIDARAN
jgi:invasion protein IalB